MSNQLYEWADVEEIVGAIQRGVSSALRHEANGPEVGYFVMNEVGRAGFRFERTPKQPPDNSMWRPEPPPDTEWTRSMRASSWPDWRVGAAVAVILLVLGGLAVAFLG